MADMRDNANAGSGQVSGPTCCMCGKQNLSTVEGDGGTECEIEKGVWVCSFECWEVAVDPYFSYEETR